MIEPEVGEEAIARLKEDVRWSSQGTKREMAGREISMERGVPEIEWKSRGEKHGP